MNFVKLVNFEWKRLGRLLAALLALVMAIQIAGLIVKSTGYMDRVNQAIQYDGITEIQAIERYGTFSFDQVMNSFWFIGPIYIGVASVLFYIFFIWYRDWFGKNTFIYRLLMLPTERVNIYLAKLVTILMMTFSFIAMQLIFLLFELQMMKWLVPESYGVDQTVRETLMSSIDTGILFPATFTEFVLYYGTGITIVSIIFTSILFERSFRLKGIILGIVYAVAAVCLFLSPILFDSMLYSYMLLPEEVLGLMILTGLITLIISIGMSAYLLRKKIRV